MEEIKKSTLGMAFSRTFGWKASQPAKPDSPTQAAATPPTPPTSPQAHPHKPIIDTQPSTLAAGAAATKNGKPQGKGSITNGNILLSPVSIPSPTDGTVTPPESAGPFPGSFPESPSPFSPTAGEKVAMTTATNVVPPPVHFAATKKNTKASGETATTPKSPLTAKAHVRESTVMSTASTDSDMMPVTLPENGLNPADILMNRLLSYRAIVKNLQQYFIEIVLVEQGTSKAMQRASTLIYVPFKDGHQFVGQGGLQDVCIGVRDSAKTRSEQHAAAAKFVDETVVKNLRRLKQDIKVRVKTLKSDTALYSNRLFKERETTQEKIGQLAKAIGLFEKVGYQADMEKVQSDPYLIHLALKRQLAKQVNEENVFARALQQCQEQIRTFECHIIKEIKQILAGYAQYQLGHAGAGFSQSWAQTELSLQVLQEDTEWKHFIERHAARLFPSDLVDADPEELDYPCKENAYVIPIKTAHLSRQSSVLKNWKDGFFVLTLAGWLHVFSSSKDLATGDSVPERSIYLPTAVLGPHSDAAQKQHVFSLDGKGMGGILHRDAQTFTVRAHSREEMLAWWAEVAKRTQSNMTTVTQQGNGAGNPSRAGSVARSNSVTRLTTKAPQGPSPPYTQSEQQILDDKAEIPGTMTITRPAVVTTTTKTTAKSNGESVAVKNSRAPPLRRQNTGSTISLNTSDFD
ncbi:hypothetical protein BGX29_009584 [Mortierella sp. GBA35]|nr:hypothetical protein BGX23_012428 [Mortierella sp. AD031]KAF9106428.1 hypothetical protein BGX29_009584 [Mortierella sp. GBA35]